MNQMEFAKLLGWSRDALTKIETGKLIAGEALIAKAANALSLTINDALALCRGGENEDVDARGIPKKGARRKASRHCARI